MISDDIIPCRGSGDLVGCDLDASSNNSSIFSYIMIKLAVNTPTEGNHIQQQCGIRNSDEHAHTAEVGKVWGIAIFIAIHNAQSKICSMPY